MFNFRDLDPNDILGSNLQSGQFEVFQHGSLVGIVTETFGKSWLGISVDPISNKMRRMSTHRTFEEAFDSLALKYPPESTDPLTDDDLWSILWTDINM